MSDTSTKTSELLVLDLGRQKKSAIRELKEGSGPLMDQVQEAAREAVAQYSESGKDVVPVIIVYRKRSRKPRGLLSGIFRGL
jgi:hypothetical protein